MRILNVLLLSIVAISCGGGKPETQEEKPAPKSYFPISEYIKGEIKTVDSLPVGILKETVSGSKKDSSFIQRTEFHALATPFWAEGLEKSALESKYTEHSFMDQTTGYYTFTYEPTVSDAPFQRIDVLVTAGSTFDKVRSIYLERSSSQNDTAINERLYWKANTSFSITKEKIYKNQSPVVEQVSVIWDPSAY